MTTEAGLTGEIRAILKDRKLKLEDRVSALANLLGADDDDTLYTLDVNDARIPVETIDAYGLRIAVDANGRASTIHCDQGFFIDEKTPDGI
jgi:hypothetical protein